MQGTAQLFFTRIFPHSIILGMIDISISTDMGDHYEKITGSNTPVIYKLFIICS